MALIEKNRVIGLRGRNTTRMQASKILRARVSFPAVLSKVKKLLLHMSTLRRSAIVTACLAVFSVSIVPRASGQFEDRLVREGYYYTPDGFGNSPAQACSKRVPVTHDLPCNIQEGYQYIFTGSVLSASAVSESDARLLLAPEEVFYGTPGSQMTVFLHQGPCPENIKPGDRWVFYVYRNENTQELYSFAGGASGPLQDRQEDIALLRRMMRLDGSGLIMGYVESVAKSEKIVTSLPIPNHKVLAREVPGGTEYAATTDKEGDYEFEPLPPGLYKLSANTETGLWAEEGYINVRAQGCAIAGFKMHPDASLSGHVSRDNGDPAMLQSVEIIPVSGGDPTFVIADENGNFQVRGLSPGLYWVGVPTHPYSEGPAAYEKIYYPGVQDRSRAIPLEVGSSERQIHIDFQVPSASTPFQRFILGGK